MKMEVDVESQMSTVAPEDFGGNSKKLVSHTLRGLGTVRPVVGPLAVHYCAQLSHVSIRDYTLNPRTLADCVLRYYETFHPDAIWLSADTWVTAEAMGATVAFPSGNQPLGGDGHPCVRSVADIDRIPTPHPKTQGRCPIMLDALRYIVDAIGKEAFIVACFDQYPFSLACALMGIEQLMIALMDDPAMAEALMERCAEYAITYAMALADAGADMLSGGDSPAGLIGPRLYREVALPFERRVITQLKSQRDAFVSLHICGNPSAILADMAAASGADVLELDHQIDIAEACRVVTPRIAIWGNLDPVGLLAQATPDRVRHATASLMRTIDDCEHKRFVISSGCTLTPGTPSANLQTMIETVRNGCPTAAETNTIWSINDE